MGTACWKHTTFFANDDDDSNWYFIIMPMPFPTCWRWWWVGSDLPFPALPSEQVMFPFQPAHWKDGDRGSSFLIPSKIRTITAAFHWKTFHSFDCSLFLGGLLLLPLPSSFYTEWGSIYISFILREEGEWGKMEMTFVLYFHSIHKQAGY